MVYDHTTITKGSNFIYLRVECPERSPAKLDEVEGQYCFYILECSDNSLYCGSSSNLIDRLTTHGTGKATEWTKIRRPIQLVYFEIYGSLLAARQRELQVKGWTRKKKEYLINGKWGKSV